FQEFKVDFRHPFIEIDSNKCILCSRCIRICHEMVGADALGLVNRGFKSYVTPALGLPLQQTACESCGLCITTCPTGAINENYGFKPGPLPLETIESIDMFGSEGYEVNLHHYRGEFYGASSRKGEINRLNLINRRQLFGYKLFNSQKRITKPLLKVEGSWKEISFDAAITTILERIKNVHPDENAFFGGARLTNEELYLIQKLARAGVKTNNVSSFHYLERGDGYFFNSNENASYCDLRGASKIYFVGNEVHLDHPIINHIAFNTRFKEGIEIVLLTTQPNNRFSKKVDKVIAFKNYFFFIKAVNFYLVKHHLHNAMFIHDRTQGWEGYVKELLKCDFDRLLHQAGTTEEVVADFARDFNEEMNAILVFQEKELSGNASMALHNLAMITGKLGKTANGLIALKERNNSHGIFDMGVCEKIGVGAEPILDKDLQFRMNFTWKTKHLPHHVNPVRELLQEGKIKNVFIFGEDPIGCAFDKTQVEQMLKKTDFMVVQDIMMSETAFMADLILPASFVWEMGGSFTNSQRKIQLIGQQLQGPVLQSSFNQLVILLKALGVHEDETPDEAMNEALTLLPKRGEYKDLHFVYKEHDNLNRLFKHGCDVLMKTINEEFAEKLDW
ncbi:MAG: molybdopterin-dependent oxidoreductase, partial [Bacteroidales bacterium]|nr:molybdopterin-dependent oxidoreductase [Bacteroidales bacterium]